MNFKDIAKKINWTYVAIVACVLILLVVLYFYNRPMGLSYCASEQFSGENVSNESEEVESTNNSGSNGNNSYKEPDAEVVLYYATWCGYSRMFLPEWEKFQNHVKQNMPNVKATMVRCEGGNEATCSQKGVEGYPTVILYRKDGREVQFNEERSSQKLIEFTRANV